MIDLARKIWEIMNVEKPFKVKFVKGFKFDIKRRVPNVQKIKKYIGWEPQMEFEKGLKEVISWLKNQQTQGKLAN